MPDNSMKHVYILLYKGNVLNGSNEQQKKGRQSVGRIYLGGPIILVPFLLPAPPSD